MKPFCGMTGSRTNRTKPGGRTFSDNEQTKNPDPDDKKSTTAKGQFGRPAGQTRVSADSRLRGYVPGASGKHTGKKS